MTGTLGSRAFKEPFAVRHQEFLVYGCVKETFAQKNSSVTFSDPNFKKIQGDLFGTRSFR